MITRQNTKTLYDLVNQAGRLYGDKTFLRYETEGEIREESYERFLQDSNAVTAFLEQYCKSSKRLHVALWGGCSKEYLTSFFGIVSGRHVAIPMDPKLSVEMVCENLKQADTDVLLYADGLEQDIAAIQKRCPLLTHCISFREIARIQEQNAIWKADKKPQEEDLAVIIFTSGTTGKSKGVMLSHRNLIDNVFCMTEKQDQKDEVYLNVLPIHHIFCLNGDVFLLMRYGATLCICPELAKLMESIQKFKPTMLRMVPMMSKMLYNKIMMTAKGEDRESLVEAKNEVLGSQMKRIVSGGGYLPEELAMKYREVGIVIGQGYGMSECSPKIAAPDYDRIDKIASVGRIVEGCQVRIQDGEIQVKSPSVMMGYYKEQKLTEEVFTEDGFLKTGDLGYVDEENFLYLTGRKKNLIILSNGENVSPEMIENLYVDDKIVSEILVYGAAETIAAQIYPNYDYIEKMHIGDFEEQISALVQLHNNKLPSYARVSQHSIRKTPFLKTASNKIKRAENIELILKTEQSQHQHKECENAFQKQLHEILSGIMGSDSFGIEDNLYECGLDSMGSVMFVEEIHNRLHKEISLGELLEHPTVAQLEQFFTRKKADRGIDYSPRQIYALTGMQKYFAYVIPGNTTGNLPFTYQLNSSIDMERLQQAVYDVLDAHPGLKGILKRGPKGYYELHRNDERQIEVPIEKITEDEWNEIKHQLIKPFTYTEDDNLCHIHLFETECAKYIFFDVAHLMGDGISMNIIFEDLEKAYQGEKIEKEDYSVYEYILENLNRAENGEMAKDIGYVDNLMKQNKVKRCILNRKGNAICKDGRNGVIRKRLSDLHREEIAQFCKENGISDNVLFLTAFNYSIAMFSGEQDVFCNSIHSGRTDSRWSRIVGPLFLTYYCTYHKEQNQKTIDMLKKTSKQILHTMQCQTSCPREGEMFFQYQGDILEIEKIGGCKPTRVRQQLDSLPFHMMVMTDAEGYYTELRFWENRFAKDQLEIFLTCYEQLVNAMTREANSKALYKYLPSNVFAKTVLVNEESVQENTDLCNIVSETRELKGLILDEAYHRKPIGAWGTLYLVGKDLEKHGFSKVNLKQGTIYDSGIVARVLPDGTLDFLEESGRLVLTDGSQGRHYYDLRAVEAALTGWKSVSCAEAYLYYDKEIHEMSLAVELETERKLDVEELKEYLSDTCGTMLVPKIMTMRCHDVETLVRLA